MENFNLKEYRAGFDLEDSKDFFDSDTFFDSDGHTDFFDLGESKALSHIDYQKVWYGPCKPTELCGKEHLAEYLKKPLEARMSNPFFTFSPHLDEKLAGVNTLKLMNKLLQSRRESWPQYIQDIFKTQPSESIKNFWAFISELADYMPTPCLQTTFVAVSKEKEKLALASHDNTSALHAIFDFLLPRYARRIKEHVVLLGKKVGQIEKQGVIDIFTRNAQEKMGEYGIQLEKTWSTSEEVVLYKNWASHMLVYRQVEGAVKGLLETQAIQASLISPGMGYERGQCIKNWKGEHSQALAKEAVDIIQSLDKDSLKHFEKQQSKYSYGISSGLAYDLEKVKKVLEFWMKYMPFYLDINFHPGSWKPHVFFCSMITDTTENNDFEEVMQHFLPITIKWDPESIIIRFLLFLRKNSNSDTLKDQAQNALTYIQNEFAEENPSKLDWVIKEKAMMDTIEDIKEDTKKNIEEAESVQPVLSQNGIWKIWWGLFPKFGTKKANKDD
ncbi:hypothetical protein DFH28DRAFT_1080100 [Melampsora americana]|nr:hypothetical protein DFH28DRAFT_1080100 [Melampsora americana]